MHSFLVLHSAAMMEELSEVDRARLLEDIANRAGKASELAKWYGVTVTELRAFTEEHQAELQALREIAGQRERQPPAAPEDITPRELDDLWITKKTARLTRYELVADVLYKDILHGGLSGTELATAVREFRSYCNAAANELGQLLHRGAGESADGDVLTVELQGIDLENLK